ENIHLEQENSAHKHETTTSFFVLNKIMQEQLAKISSTIDETRSKRPRLSSNEDGDDEELQRRHAEEVAELKAKINELNEEKTVLNEELTKVKTDLEGKQADSI